MSSELKIETPCFAVVSYDNVIVTQRIEELMSAISQREYFYCEVAVLNKVEEAERYAVQKYYATFYANPFLTEETAMPLPTPANNQFYNLKSNRLTTAICESDKNLELTEVSPSAFNLMYPQYKNPDLLQNASAGTFWSVEAMNGYAVANDLNMLAYFLTRQGFIYPRAVPYQNEILASIKARAGFIERFARRYGFEIEQLEYLPMLANGNYFVDEFHREREMRRMDKSDKAKTFGFWLAIMEIE